MIKISVSSTGWETSIQHDIDATPWFEQASNQQMKRLRSERQYLVGGDGYLFYSGEQTDDIFGWLAENHPTPESQAILAFCDLHEIGWVVELDASEVERYLVQRKASKAAKDAVDNLLGN